MPEVRFARTSDRLRIAYQDFGDGPPAVFVPGLISNVELIWEHERCREILERTAEQFRVISFDKRGIGCSSRFEELPTLDQRIEDIIAVMDAAGVERAHLHGLSEGGLMAAHFAARHPDRVGKLVLSNCLAGADRFEEIGDHRGEMLDMLREMLRTHGEVNTAVMRWFIASDVGDPVRERWWARLNRQSASADGLRRQLDSIGVLNSPDYDRIEAETLVISCSGDRLVPPHVSRRTASLIPNARYVEFDSADHFWFAGDAAHDIVDAVSEFILGDVARPRSTRIFATVLFTDLVGSTDRSGREGDERWHAVVDRHNRIGREIVHDAGGTYVKSTGDGMLAHFPTPSAAIDAATRLRSTLDAMGLPVRAGLHTGEVELHADGDISGIAVNLAARVEQRADDGTIYVSSTVRDLLLGTGYELADRGEHELRGFDGPWRLYEVAGARG